MSIAPEILDAIEERLLRLVGAAWDDYRASPAPKVPPDTSIEWRQIRMIRHIKLAGSERLSQRQSAELALLVAFTQLPNVRGEAEERSAA